MLLCLEQLHFLYLKSNKFSPAFSSNHSTDLFFPLHSLICLQFILVYNVQWGSDIVFFFFLELTPAADWLIFPFLADLKCHPYHTLQFYVSGFFSGRSSFFHWSNWYHDISIIWLYNHIFFYLAMQIQSRAFKSSPNHNRLVATGFGFVLGRTLKVEGATERSLGK